LRKSPIDKGQERVLGSLSDVTSEDGGIVPVPDAAVEKADSEGKIAHSTIWSTYSIQQSKKLFYEGRGSKKLSTFPNEEPRIAAESSGEAQMEMLLQQQ